MLSAVVSDLPEFQRPPFAPITMDSGELGYWRNYFKRAKSSIIEVIENAVQVAALDCPDEFKLFRGRISEKLYSVQCLRYVQKTGKDNGGDFEVENKENILNKKLENKGGKLDEGGFKNITRNDNVSMFRTTPGRMLSDLEAQALEDEIEKGNLIVGEVLSIKEVLENSEDQTDIVLFECLRKLQEMAVSLDILEVTEIGKIVNRFRKHNSKRICQLAKALIKDWRKVVDDWVNATQEIPDTGNAMEFVDPWSDDDLLIGLPLPPLDSGAFFSNPTFGMELTKIFDGIDDDGNLIDSTEFHANHNNRTESSPNNHDMSKLKSNSPKEDNVVVKNKGTSMKQESVLKVTELPINRCRAGTLPKLKMEEKLIDKTIVNKRHSTCKQNNFKFPDEAAVEKKLESTKRKLQEGYLHAKNAKKQRTVQFMDLHELPEQLVHGNPVLKRQKNHCRPSTKGTVKRKQDTRVLAK